MGNRLHLAFKRQVPTEQARAYAEKNCMTFFEVSPLCNFNVIESFTELSRIVLMRHGMEKIWRPNRGEARAGPAGEGRGPAAGATAEQYNDKGLSHLPLGRLGPVPLQPLTFNIP